MCVRIIIVALLSILLNVVVQAKQAPVHAHQCNRLAASSAEDILNR
ncbi:hypothetical protein KK062_24365 [Fulvivirgaceae bacterium PWU5]|uniref:Uncharacterized protein n=1 Tax=Dawidia cretensis TaxID=2782350 RepID=A0AAP2E3H6_9BACT|nr:hypothetical protein [Dawidia cretensis]